MSAHTRTRLPAALCVLLLLTFGSIARAGMPSKPIDRSGGLPDTEPVMVGDPDAGHNGLWAYTRQLLIAAQLNLSFLPTYAPPVSATTPHIRRPSSLRVRRR
jgi:hypothetical protein